MYKYLSPRRSTMKLKIVILFIGCLAIRAYPQQDKAGTDRILDFQPDGGKIDEMELHSQGTVNYDNFLFITSCINASMYCYFSDHLFLNFILPFIHLCGNDLVSNSLMHRLYTGDPPKRFYNKCFQNVL